MSETKQAVDQFDKDVQDQELPDGTGGKYSVPPDTAPSSATNPALGEHCCRPERRADSWPAAKEN